MLSSRSVTANTTIQAASRSDLISGAEISMSARAQDAPQTRPASSISDDSCLTLLRRNMKANGKRCAVNAMKNSQIVPNSASGSVLKHEANRERHAGKQSHGRGERQEATAWQ